MENNKTLAEQLAEKQESAVGYWSTPEQVKEAAEAKLAEAAVVEAPVSEPVVEAVAEEAPAAVVEAPQQKIQFNH